MSIRFDNRVAIVTGAGSGLGRSHALLLASRGAKVVVNDLGGAVDGSGSSLTPAQQVVAEIQAAGGTAIANADSVASPEGAQRMVQAAIDQWGRVDILVNNAGILRDRTILKMTPQDFDAVVAVHLAGSAYCTMAAWPHMKEANFGRIVMTTSAAGLFGNFGQANYAAAKLGIVGLMNALKHEGAKYDIRVNTVAPIALTRMTEDLIAADVKPRLKPEYVSSMVAWFCAAENQATGDIVEVGAGYYARVQIMEGEGVLLGDGQVPAPEEVRDNYTRICDMRSAKPFASANEVMGRVFGEIQRPSK